MAIWQFTVVLVPYSWAVEHEFSSESLYEKDGFTTEPIWNTTQLKLGFQKKIERILPKAKSWSEELQVWGAQSKNDIQIWYKERITSGIFVRIDLRDSPMTFVRSVVQLATELDCVFFFRELATMTEATEENLVEEIRKSEAFKFVRDPHDFLENLSRN